MGYRNRYPIVLVHGIALKERAFCKVDRVLEREGYLARPARFDAFATVENSAAQLKDYILGLLRETGAEKVSIIAHSKGGLDAKYMLKELGMEARVASLTTLCTPHRGSGLATHILQWPQGRLRFLNACINFFYRLWGDRKPESLAVCRQLQLTEKPYFETEGEPFSGSVYCQSYSAVTDEARENYVKDAFLDRFRKYEDGPSDCVVSVESSKFGIYRGDCLPDSLSHNEVLTRSTTKAKKEKMYAFYVALCEDLCERGF